MPLPQNILDQLNKAESDLEAAQASDATLATATKAVTDAQAAQATAQASALSAHTKATDSATQAVALIKQYFALP
jgi:hypothetical protein